MGSVGMRLLGPECCLHLNLRQGGPRLHLSRRSLRCREDDRALKSPEVGGKDARGGFNHGQVIMEAKIATGHSEVEVQLFLM